MMNRETTMESRTTTKLRMIAAVLSFYDDPMLAAARDELRQILRERSEAQKALPEGSIPDWRENTEQANNTNHQ